MMSSIQQFYQDCFVKFALMGLPPMVKRQRYYKSLDAAT